MIKGLQLLNILGLLIAPAFAQAEWREGPRDNWGHRHYDYRESNDHDRYGPRKDPYYAFGNRGGYDNRKYGFGSDQINHGIRTGQLSRNEVRELEQKEQKIRYDQAAYRADGRVTKKERDALQDDIHDYYHDLNHELNDGEKRW